MSDGKELTAALDMDPGDVVPRLVSFIRERAEALRRDGLILGLSGGLDSAVVATLCARALGPGRTLALVMPDRDTPREQVGDALSFASEIGIDARLIRLDPILRKMGVYRLFFLNRLPLPRGLRERLARRAHRYFLENVGETPFRAGALGIPDGRFSSHLRNSTAYYRVKHRLRMVLLYLEAEKENRLVVGAANRTEARIGFFVKHGCDQAADIMPIINLYKVQVRRVARHLGIPARFIEKAPSPDVVPGITDEEAIGLSYEILDPVLLALERGWDGGRIAAALGVRDDMVERVAELVERTGHMRTVFIPPMRDE